MGFGIPEVLGPMLRSTLEVNASGDWGSFVISISAGVFMMAVLRQSVLVSLAPASPQASPKDCEAGAVRWPSEHQPAVDSKMVTSC